MTETSLATFSAGRVETNAQAGARGRFGALVFDDAGLASAKHTFLPFGVAVYAPQVPNWPISVGSALAATAAAGLASGFAGAGRGASFEAFGDALCACARPVTPHTSTLAAKAVSIRRTDMTKSGSLIIVTGRWPDIPAHGADG